MTDITTRYVHANHAPYIRAQGSIRISKAGSMKREDGREFDVGQAMIKGYKTVFAFPPSPPCPQLARPLLQIDQLDSIVCTCHQTKSTFPSQLVLLIHVLFSRSPEFWNDRHDAYRKNDLDRGFGVRIGIWRGNHGYNAKPNGLTQPSSPRFLCVLPIIVYHLTYIIKP